MRADKNEDNGLPITVQRNLTFSKNRNPCLPCPDKPGRRGARVLGLGKGSSGGVCSFARSLPRYTAFLSSASSKQGPDPG